MVNSQSLSMTPSAASHTTDHSFPPYDVFFTGFWDPTRSKFSFHQVSHSPSLLCWFVLISPTSQRWNVPMAPLQGFFSSLVTDTPQVISSGPVALKYQLSVYITSSSPLLNFRLRCPNAYSTPLPECQSYLKLKKSKTVHEKHNILNQLYFNFF